MFHKLKPLQRRRDFNGYIPIVIYSNTLPCAHAGPKAGPYYPVTNEILVRSNRGKKRRNVLFMKFKSLEQCTIIYGNSNRWSNLINWKFKF